MRKRIGEMLMDDGIITKEQLEQALDIQKKDGAMLGAILVELAFIDEEILLDYLKKQGTRVKVEARPGKR